MHTGGLNRPVHKDHGIEIERVLPSSAAYSAGIRAGDVIISINGHKVCDVVDFLFYSKEEELDILIMRKNMRLSFKLSSCEGKEMGLEIKPFKIKICRNKCLFCFVSQLPKGLRKTLYVKDEDYRMSFLYGNYVTLTSLIPQEKKRIVEQRLSPLYLSIHSTNKTIRNILLGNPKAPDILKELRFFKEHKIRMHCQIVLCPGYNDGKDLLQTIRDLYKLYPYVLSIAVVPVGLTAHRKSPVKMNPVEKDDAAKAIAVICSFQKRFRKKHGDSIVYAADELYLKAGIAFPPLHEYGEFPQLENGVGMVPLFSQQAKKINIAQVTGTKRFITFTGISFYPFLSKFVDKLNRGGIDIEAIAVENTFFSTSITVAGLLTGRDVVRSLSEVIRKDDILLIPNIVMREGHEVFLDDLSRQDIQDLLGIKVVVIESTPRGLVDAITALS
jgi:putative radical SAM enzyme (TIGR03279 family)